MFQVKATRAILHWVRNRHSFRLYSLFILKQSWWWTAQPA